MVNEHYEEEGQEEGEYHFSDDQVNYEMEPEGASKEGLAVAPKESVTDKLKQHRRIVIGLVVFIILLGIVYQLMTPSSTPALELQPNTTNEVKTPSNNPMPAQTVSMPQTPAVVQTVPRPVQQVSQTIMPAPVSSAPAVAVTTTTTTALPSQDKNISARVSQLEEQNSAMMNLLQTQYAQKIADAELQNNQLRAQVQELNTRISGMEVAFRQLTKILRNSSANSNQDMANGSGSTRVRSPKNIYTVQAIIPGRAWLKADSGETVTVAEGDILKGYGRITKIDPYDGNVDIDTGNHVISLSYGLSGD